MKSKSFEKKTQSGYASPFSADFVVDCDISAVCESGDYSGGNSGVDTDEPGRPRTRSASLDDNAFEDTVF